MKNYEIIRYQGGRNAEVAAFILAIQRDDVGLDVPINEQPELLNISDAYRHDGFWLAIADGKIVGTIGVMRYGSSGILKKLFVHRDYRGPRGASHTLHAKAISWAEVLALDAMFLDTPSVATRSHGFYRRQGYQIVGRSELPEEYAFPDRDSLIFKLDIASTR